MKLRLSEAQSRLLTLIAIWAAPVISTLLSIHAKIAVPYYADGTGGGRWERLENPWPWCVILLLCALWLSQPKLHTRLKLRVFGALAFVAYLVDVSFFATLFGPLIWALGVGALCESRSGKFTAKSSTIEVSGAQCESCGRPLAAVDAVCYECENALMHKAVKQ